MSPKEKAIELVEKYTNVRWDIDPDTAKQCALIAVEEVINSMTVATSVYLPFWQDVKSEIKQL